MLEAMTIGALAGWAIWFVSGLIECYRKPPVRDEREGLLMLSPPKRSPSKRAVRFGQHIGEWLHR